MKRGRFLIATPGFTGHATPELTLARRLVRRGHAVSVYAPAELERQVAAAGAVHLPFAAFQLRRHSEAVPLAEQIRQGARHFESPALAEELVDLLQRERVDVAVIDYLLAAAFTAAERVPTACVLPVLYTPWALWYGQHVYDDGAARAALGLGEASTALASSAKLVLVFSTRRFDFPIRGRRDRRVEYVGRMIDPELPRWDSPWPPDDRRPLVLVSPSSLYRRQRPAQLQQILDALGELPVRVLATLGLDANGDTLQAPANAVVRNWVPHEAALPGATLVVTNGGHNTVLAALAHRRPGPGLSAHARAGVERQARRGVRGGTATGAERDVGRDPSGARGTPPDRRHDQRDLPLRAATRADGDPSGGLPCASERWYKGRAAR